MDQTQAVVRQSSKFYLLYPHLMFRTQSMNSNLCWGFAETENPNQSTDSHQTRRAAWLDFSRTLECVTPGPNNGFSPWIINFCSVPSLISYSQRRSQQTGSRPRLSPTKRNPRTSWEAIPSNKYHRNWWKRGVGAQFCPRIERLVGKIIFKAYFRRCSSLSALWLSNENLGLCPVELPSKRKIIPWKLVKNRGKRILCLDFNPLNLELTWSWILGRGEWNFQHLTPSSRVGFHMLRIPDLGKMMLQRERAKCNTIKRDRPERVSAYMYIFLNI